MDGMLRVALDDTINIVNINNNNKAPFYTDHNLSTSTTTTTTTSKQQNDVADCVAFLDRTCEFNEIVVAVTNQKNQQLKQQLPSVINENNNNQLQQQQNVNGAQSRFSIIASHMGKDINIITRRLSELTELAKSKSLYNEVDLGPKISKYTTLINDDVRRLNQELDLLKKEAELIRQQREPQQNSKKPKKSHDFVAHSESIVSYFQLALHKATGEFRDVLNTRTQNLKQQQEKRQKLLGESPLAIRKSADNPLYKPTKLAEPEPFTPSRADLVSVAVPIAPKEPYLTRSSAVQHFSASNSLLNTSHDNGDLEQGASVGGITEQAMVVRHHENYFESRATAIRQVETTLVELQSIFHQMAQLVQDQSELVRRIDDRVEESVINIEGASREIQKAETRAKSNKLLILKVFGVLMFFAVLFILFFV